MFSNDRIRLWSHCKSEYFEYKKSNLLKYLPQRLRAQFLPKKYFPNAVVISSTGTLLLTLYLPFSTPWSNVHDAKSSKKAVYINVTSWEPVDTCWVTLKKLIQFAGYCLDGTYFPICRDFFRFSWRFSWQRDCSRACSHFHCSSVSVCSGLPFFRYSDLILLLFFVF